MATINGTSGDDAIDGTPGDDQISGLGGNDNISAGAGNDTIYGGTGNDNLSGDAGDDTINGDAGTDTIYGRGGSDTIDGGDAADTIYGDFGIEFADDGNDQINGGAGNDTIHGGAGNDTINGGANDDTLSGGHGADSIDGGDGNDWIGGYGEYDPNAPDDGVGDVLIGGLGDDSFSAGYADSVDGGSGIDRLYYNALGGAAGITADFSQLANGGTAIVAGGTLTGIEYVLGIDGSNFNDTIVADPVPGTDGITVNGWGGDDALTGTAFADYMDGGDGNDTIHALAGNDTIHGGLGDDTVDGGDGADTIYGDSFPISVPSDGNDTLNGGVGNDTIYGGGGNDVINGGGDADNLTGGRGADQIDGGDGNDVLTAGESSNEDTAVDVLTGGAGNDRIFAGYGDSVDGGTGTDSLSYDATSSTAGINVDFSTLTSGGTINIGGATLSGIEIVDQITATNFDDTIIAGAPGANTTVISGLGGNDHITGSAGADRLIGGDDDDVLTGGAGGDTLFGLDGNDTFRDTAAGFNGDTIDLTTDDTIIITDANINSFSFSVTGGYITYNGGSWIYIGSQPVGHVVASAAVGGGIQLKLELPPVATNDQIADQLINGFWNWNGEGAHHFNVGQGGTITIDIHTLNSTEQSMARMAFGQWHDIIEIKFQEVTTGAQILVTDEEDPTAGGSPSAYTEDNSSGGITASAHIHISSSWVSYFGSELGSYGYQTYLHEIGHALGLGHAGNYNVTADYGTDALFANDSYATTVMSYFDQAENYYVAGKHFSTLGAVTPMQADILAAQLLYGVPSSTRLGDTIYGQHSNAGPAFDATVNGDVAYTIFDSGGNDTIDYSGFFDAQLINLNPETFSNVVHYTGNLSIARGVVIENAIGGFGPDTLIGNSVANVLTGNAGDDHLTGNGGNDTLDGGQDDDILDGGAGNDTLTGGSGFWDTLIGGAGTDSLDGGAGNDRYIINTAAEHTAAEIHDSGPQNGFDQNIVFFTAPAGTLTLFAGDTGLTHAYLSNDSLDPSTAPTNIDASAYLGDITLVGNAGNNQITGGSAHNSMFGYQGDDVLTGGGGNDVLDGGTGNDRLYGGGGDDVFTVDSAGDQVFESSGKGSDRVRAFVSYTLAAGQEIELLTAEDNVAGTTVINLTGNDAGNTIYGNAAANLLKGGGGDDVISGLDGSDDLRGDSGNDALDGMAGDDRLTGGDGNDQLTGGAGYDRMYGGLGDDRYFVDDATDFAYENAGEGHDTIQASVDCTLRANVEDLILWQAAVIGKGNGLDNVISGSDIGNKLYGVDGNDRVDGGDGDDYVFGGSGNDVMSGGAGYDRIYGGTGDDTYYVNDGTDFAYENAGEGNDRVISSLASYQLRANVEELDLAEGSAAIRGYGQGDNNTLVGNSADNLLYGRDGNDWLQGNAGNDILYGEKGNDTLLGRAGMDRFYGGTGADKFVFRNGDFAGMTSGTADRIHDFSQADHDIIHLSGVDANSLAAGDQAFTFIGSAAFSHTPGELRAYQSIGNTYVAGDLDGDGVVDFLIRVDGLHALSAADFIL